MAKKGGGSTLFILNDVLGQVGMFHKNNCRGPKQKKKDLHENADGDTWLTIAKHRQAPRQIIQQAKESNKKKSETPTETGE